MVEERALLSWSATRLAAAIRAGEVTSREVVEAHIAHVERVNPVLNAIVCERFDAARREAAAADERVRAGGDLPPFLGVPCTIKEAFAFPGLPQTGGLVARRDKLSEEPATAVGRLVDAGFIPLGLTNVSELCMWMESSNRVYGRTNNAYDPARTAGGSSGGEGAIVGAGGSPVGLGSDIGGSIRGPAFFNGVFGHKPTGTLVPSTGQFPVAENDALRYLTTGPIARRAEDLMPVLRVLAGPDGKDPVCEPMPLGDPDKVDIEGLEVVSVHGNGLVRVSGEIRAAQQRCERVLARAGARVRVIKIDDLKHSLDIWAAAMSDAADTRFRDLLGDGIPTKGLRELGKWAVRRSPHTLPSIVLVLLEHTAELLPGRVERFVQMRESLKRQLVDEIGDGVMLYPPYPSAAPRHHFALVPPINWVYWAIFNVTELPVTQAPLGLGAKGVPLGIQVAARHGNDHVSIAVARFFERRFGGWVWPPRWMPRRVVAAAAR